jgi:hypothetical protein
MKNPDGVGLKATPSGLKPVWGLCDRQRIKKEGVVAHNTPRPFGEVTVEGKRPIEPAVHLAETCWLQPKFFFEKHNFVVSCVLHCLNLYGLRGIRGKKLGEYLSVITVLIGEPRMIVVCCHVAVLLLKVICC